MRALVWFVRAFIFFALFAFALNNQHEVTLHWFFGVEWHAPLVIVVLAAFAVGAATGVLAMLPRWWRRWRASRPVEVKTPDDVAASPPTRGAASTAVSSEFGAEAIPPPRAGM